MPHKRATRPAREREKARRATDLAPRISVEHEPIPKSVSRVLDAGQIRREYRKKKRQLDGVSSSGEDNYQRKKRRQVGVKGDMETPALAIKPSETVAQFNRRVENSLMPLIKTALRQSSAQARRVRREEVTQETLKRDKQTDNSRRMESSKKGSDPPPETIVGETANPLNSIVKEFQVAPTSAPRRLNDIAQEPPVMKRLPRGATKNDVVLPGALSMAQRAMMEEERDKAIRHYRELKARKLHEGGGLKLDG